MSDLLIRPIVVRMYANRSCVARTILYKWQTTDPSCLRPGCSWLIDVLSGKFDVLLPVEGDDIMFACSDMVTDCADEGRIGLRHRGCEETLCAV